MQTFVDCDVQYENGLENECFVYTCIGKMKIRFFAGELFINYPAR